MIKQKINSKTQNEVPSNLNVLRMVNFDCKKKQVSIEVNNSKVLLMKEQKQFDKIYAKVFFYMVKRCRRYDIRVTRLVDKMYKSLQAEIFWGLAPNLYKDRDIKNCELQNCLERTSENAILNREIDLSNYFTAFLGQYKRLLEEIKLIRQEFIIFKILALKDFTALLNELKLLKAKFVILWGKFQNLKVEIKHIFKKLSWKRFKMQIRQLKSFFTKVKEDFKWRYFICRQDLIFYDEDLRLLLKNLNFLKAQILEGVESFRLLSLNYHEGFQPFKKSWNLFQTDFLRLKKLHDMDIKRIKTMFRDFNIYLEGLIEKLVKFNNN